MNEEAASRFSRNLLFQYGLQLAKYIIPFITIPYLTRVLSADGFGVRAYVLSVMTIVAVVMEFGFMQTATKKVAERRDDRRSVEEAIGAVIWAKIFLSLAVCLGVFLLTWAVPLLRENAVYVGIALFGTVLNSFVPDFVFMGYEDMRIITLRYVVAKGFGALLIFALVRSPEDLLVVPAIDALTSGVAVIWSYLGTKRTFGVGVRMPSLKAGWDELKESALVAASNLSSTFFNSYTAVAVGIILSGPYDVAIWSLASTVVSACQSLFTPVYNSLYAYMVANRGLMLFKKIVSVGIAGSIIARAGLAALSEPVILLLGGAEYAQGSYLISLMTPVVWLSFLSLMFGWPLLGAFGFIKEVTATTVCSGVFNVVAVTLIGLFGFGTLAALATVRCATEAVLACSRMGVSLAKRHEIMRMRSDFAEERKVNE